jgi:hypothetical protein
MMRQRQNRKWTEKEKAIILEDYKKNRMTLKQLAEKYDMRAPSIIYGWLSHSPFLESEPPQLLSCNHNEIDRKRAQIDNIVIALLLLNIIIIYFYFYIL